MTEEKGDISSRPELSQLRDQKAEISLDEHIRSVVFIELNCTEAE